MGLFKKSPHPVLPRRVSAEKPLGQSPRGDITIGSGGYMGLAQTSKTAPNFNKVEKIGS